jgi:hypothetical protein
MKLWVRAMVFKATSKQYVNDIVAINFKTHTKNNLIDVPEKTTSSFTEASKKITVLRVLSKSN